MSFMYPRCLTLPGHLHILYNALEEGVKDMPIYKDYIDLLRIFQNMLSQRPLREKFQESCIKGKACYSLFNSYQTVHIDWRWEFLSKALDHLIPLIVYLRAHFDPQKMLAGDTGMLKCALIKQVHDALQRPCFDEMSEMLRVAGKPLREPHTN